MKCADCGQTVLQGRDGKWYVPGGRKLSPTSRSYCCRIEINGTVLVRADYHYVEGEVQRHWPPIEEAAS